MIDIHIKIKVNDIILAAGTLIISILLISTITRMVPVMYTYSVLIVLLIIFALLSTEEKKKGKPVYLLLSYLSLVSIIIVNLLKYYKEISLYGYIFLAAFLVLILLFALGISFSLISSLSQDLTDVITLSLAYGVVLLTTIGIALYFLRRYLSILPSNSAVICCIAPIAMAAYVFKGFLQHHFLEHLNNLNFPTNFLEKLVIILLPIAIVMYLYPGISVMAGSDHVRHFANSYLIYYSINYEDILKDTHCYSTPYPGYLFLLAVLQILLFKLISIYDLSATFIELFNSGLVVIFAFLISISYYNIVRKFTRDNKTTVVSLIIFTLGAGVGYFYIIKLINNFNLTSVRSNWALFYETLGDIGYGKAQYIYLFPRPTALGIFLLLVYLSQILELFNTNKNIMFKNKVSVVFTLTILNVGLYTIHIPEFIISTIIFYILLLVHINNLDYNLLSEVLFFKFISDTPLIFIHYIINKIVRFNISTLFIFTITLVDLLLIILFKSNKIGSRLLALPMNKIEVLIYSKRFRYVAEFALIFWIISIGHWLFIAKMAHYEIYWRHNLHPVPLFMYPVEFGIPGLFFVLGLLFMSDKQHPNRRVEILICVVIAMFILARIMTIINFNISNLYAEFRFIYVIHIFLSIVAAYNIVSFAELFVDRIILKLSKIKINLFILAKILLLVIIVLSIPSSLMSVSFWDTRTHVGEDVLFFYQHIRQPVSAVITTSPSSWSCFADFIPKELGLQYRVFTSEVLGETRDPVVLEKMLYNFSLKVIAYYNKHYDSEYLKEDSFIYSYLMAFEKPVYESNHSRYIVLATGKNESYVGKALIIVPDEFGLDERNFKPFWFISDVLLGSGISFDVMPKSYLSIISPKTMSNIVILIIYNCTVDNRVLEELYKRGTGIFYINKINEKILVRWYSRNNSIEIPPTFFSGKSNNTINVTLWYNIKNSLVKLIKTRTQRSESSSISIVQARSNCNIIRSYIYAGNLKAYNVSIKSSYILLLNRKSRIFVNATIVARKADFIGGFGSFVYVNLSGAWLVSADYYYSLGDKVVALTRYPCVRSDKLILRKIIAYSGSSFRYVPSMCVRGPISFSVPFTDKYIVVHTNDYIIRKLIETKVLSYSETDSLLVFLISLSIYLMLKLLTLHRRGKGACPL